MVHVELEILQVLKRGSFTDYSLLDVYANCQHDDSLDHVKNMNFVEFATTYTLVNNALTNCLKMLYQEYFQLIHRIEKAKILVFIVNISF